MYYTAREMAMSNGESYHLAAVLRRGKSNIRIGINNSKTNPRFSRTYKDGHTCYTLHAEMDALIAAQPGDTLIVFRWSKRGKVTMARPCRHCQRHIKEAGIKSVVYSHWNGKFYEERF